MAKPLAITILLLIFSANAFSQGRQRGERPDRTTIKDRVENLINSLDKELKLTEDQETSATKIFTDFLESVQNLRKSGNRPSKTQIDKISKKRDSEFETILTKSQKEKYAEIKDKVFNSRRRQRTND